MNAQEKWTVPIQSWNLALSQLAIHYDGPLTAGRMGCLPPANRSAHYLTSRRCHSRHRKIRYGTQTGNRQ